MAESDVTGAMMDAGWDVLLANEGAADGRRVVTEIYLAMESARHSEPALTPEQLQAIATEALHQLDRNMVMPNLRFWGKWP